MREFSSDLHDLKHVVEYELIAYRNLITNRNPVNLHDKR
uniref:Four helix bundle protein n=1 Tax=Ascaris lumbricoides TaxID=6252 RepID=A0A0M3HG80_ASCLU